MTVCSGWPVSMTDFSISVAVGQAWTQAPQETHSESRKSSSWPADDMRGEAAAVDGQREGALHLLAGAHAARADDAFGGIEGEIGVGRVLLGDQMVLALIAVAHLAQADGARHVLQLAIAVGGAGQAIERMVGDVELHHAAAQLAPAAASGSSPSCRARPAWCRRRACRAGPRSPPGRGGRSRRLRGCRWRRAWGS